jgi:hypothetical protein
MSLPEVAEGTCQDQVQLRYSRQPVSERAPNNISMMTSRKRRDRLEVPAAAEGQSQQAGAERATPKKPRWSSKGRLATAALPHVSRKLKTAEGHTSLRDNLFTAFYQELVGKSASTGEVVNAILHHLCTNPSLSCYHIGGIDCCPRRR